MDYPRYQPTRPTGAGAFFDYVAAAAAREIAQLKSCRIDRRPGRRPAENPFTQASSDSVPELI